MSAHSSPHTLPEELISFVCDHYAQQRQLASLAQLMRLNRRTSNYARTALFRQYDVIDDRTSRFLQGSETICEQYDDGEALDEDILSAIDCREVDPLELDLGLRWLRNIRTIKIVEIRDMLYGRDTESLMTLVRSLASRGIRLFPKLEEVIISSQVVRRIHTAEAKYPKSTPMDILIILFLGSHTKRLKVADSTAFAPPHGYTNSQGMHFQARALPFGFAPPGARPIALPSTTIGHLAPPHERAHLSHAIIHFMDGMTSLSKIIYEKVDPFIPVKPKKGVKHTVKFRPYVTPFITATTNAPVASSSTSRLPPDTRETDERSYIWEIRQAIIDIIQRSVVFPEPPEYGNGDSHRQPARRPHPPGPITWNGIGNAVISDDSQDNDDSETDDEDDEDRDGGEEDENPPSMTTPTRQSSWHFILPFSSESSQWASTLRMQVRDRIRRRYDDDLDLMEELLGNMTFEFASG